MNSLSHTAMSEFPSLEAVPGNLQYIFDKYVSAIFKYSFG
jgi:hypothetical protein